MDCIRAGAGIAGMLWGRPETLIKKRSKNVEQQADGCAAGAVQGAPWL